jgi:DNA recombination-mediator protein A
VTAIRRIRRRERGFPALLGAIHDPPPQLHLRGAADVSLLGLPSVAVVGARACSSYGRSVARSLARELAAAGLVVVSGMARGIDGEAHRGALDGGGRTVAVLGCGVDRDYPSAHAELARRICEAGLVVSEYEPGVEPAPWRFPAREMRVRHRDISASQHGGSTMNERFDEPDEVVDEDKDEVADDEIDRAPQPGNTPARDETRRPRVRLLVAPTTLTCRATNCESSPLLAPSQASRLRT